MLTHIDKENLPTMVDVSDKDVSQRIACARSIVELPKSIQDCFNGKDIICKKGPVFETAIIAGTMGVKKTSDLIPFCHPLQLEGIKVKVELNRDGNVEINCTVKNSGKTGVEMEALTGAQIAALTIYDMCKAMSQEIVIKEARLISKTGGKTDYTYSQAGLNE